MFLAREGDEEIPKVLDFGIAKQLPILQIGPMPVTRTGALLGTPYYMSPEQVLGQKAVDHRTDIWALGVIAFECLVGRRPFRGDTAGALAVAVCAGPIPLPSSMANVPEGFDAWFQRAAARDPKLRFQSIKDAMVELRQVCGVERSDEASKRPVPSPLVSGVPPGSPSGPTPGITMAPSSTTLRKLGLAGGRRWLWAAAAVALAAAGVATGIALLGASPPGVESAYPPTPVSAVLAPLVAGSASAPKTGSAAAAIETPLDAAVREPPQSARPTKRLAVPEAPAPLPKPATAPQPGRSTAEPPSASSAGYNPGF